MNERIKELVKQAGGHFSTHNLMSNPVQHRESIELWDKNIEKFAELIVAECITIVKPTQHHEVWAQSYLGGVDGLDLLYSKVKDIKKHFGVEE
jgi:hypothetical protein